MTDKRDLQALIERVEKATENDPRLFRAVYMALLPEPGPFNRSAADAAIIEAFIVGGAFTDAALALMGRVLPGWKVMIHAGGMWGEVMPGASISEPGFAALSRKGLPYRLGKANAPSLPLAIIAATLTALIAQEQAE